MDVKTFGDLVHRDGQWWMRAVPHVTMRVKRIFPRVATTSQGFIRIKDTPEVARDLEWLLSRWPMKMSATDEDLLTARVKSHRETESAVQSILNGQRRLGLLREPARPPRAYQLEAADLVLATGRLLVVDAVGLGKTMTSLLVLREENALPAAVVTLGGVLPNQWLKQLALTFPDLHGHVLRVGAVYDPAERDGREPDVLVMPYSRLDKWSPYLRGRVRTIIFDEIQELRHDGTRKYVAAQSVRGEAAYAVGLTATPVYGYGGEMHNIMEIIAPGSLGSRDEFSREWGGASTGMGSNLRLHDAGALGTYLREEGLMLRRTRKDVDMELDEPERIVQEVDTDHAYLDSETTDAVAIAERFLAGGKNAFTAAGELDWKMRQATGVAKAPHVADFVRLLLESEERILLFGWHRSVYDIWIQRLWHDFRPVLYTGSESPTQKQAALDAFASGKSRVLIMSLRSGAGIDGIQEHCSVAVFGELDWSPGIHTQNIGRLDRDGQTQPVVAYFCVSDGGTDPLMTETLELKRQQADAITDPDAVLYQTVTQSDRVQRLARAVLDRATVHPDQETIEVAAGDSP